LENVILITVAERCVIRIDVKNQERNLPFVVLDGSIDPDVVPSKVSVGV
jgi:hypothetical protein